MDNMRNLYMADVGDGQNIGMKSLFGQNIQIDCGGGSRREALDGFKRIIKDLGKPNTFILSHFHIDHYYGLLEWAKKHRYKKLNIEKVYYPVIPKPDTMKNLFERQMALNSFVYGDRTGSIELDFLNSIMRINQGGFHYRALKKNDEVNIGGTNFEVLWPPIETYNKLTSKVNGILEQFADVMEKYERFWEILDKIKERRIFDRYFGEEMEGYYEEDVEDIKKIEEKEIPDDIDDLNGEIRDISNQLSLAFKHGNYFIFWGDLKKREINNIVRDLDEDKFLITITPHHGTRWPSKFDDIEMTTTLSSNGEQRIKKFKADYKEQAEISKSTFVNGDIKISHPFFSNSRNSTLNIY